MSEYRDTFEEISCPLKIGNTDYFKGNFMNGLKEESRVELRLHPLKTLEELMDLALLIEPRNMILKKEGGNAFYSAG